LFAKFLKIIIPSNNISDLRWSACYWPCMQTSTHSITSF